MVTGHFTPNPASLSVISITGPAARAEYGRPKLHVARSCFQLFDLTQVRSTVSRHFFHKVGDGHLHLCFRVKGRLGKIRHLQISQQPQVVMTSQPIERHQFRRRRIQVVKIASPSVLINRRDHRLGVRQHLSQSISVDDLHICQVTEDFQHTPLFWRRLIVEGLIRQARNRSRNLFRTLLSDTSVWPTTSTSACRSITRADRRTPANIDPGRS